MCIRDRVVKDPGRVTVHVVDEDIEVPVAVVVAERGRHAEALVAEARLLGDVREGPAAVVAQHVVHAEVVDLINVLVAVVVVVTDRHRQAPPLGEDGQVHLGEGVAVVAHHHVGAPSSAL